MKYSSDRLVEMADDIQGIQFKSGDFTLFSNLEGWIMYCDPPYLRNSNYADEYHHYRTFDTTKFYKWAEKMAEHNLVFISERSKLPYLDIANFKNHEKLYFI